MTALHKPRIASATETGSLARLAVRVGLVMAVTVTAACGSTVQFKTGTGARDAVTDDRPDEARVGVQSSSVATGRGGGGSVRSGLASTAGRSSDEIGATSSAPGTTGRGFDKTTINIGVGRADEDESNAVVESLGVNVGDSTVDWDAAVRAIVDDINAHDGIGGRRVKVVWHGINTGEALFSPGTAAQAACATWTEDNQVFAVTAPGLAFMDDLVACLGKHDTPLIDPGGIQGDDRSYQDYYDTHPLYYAPGSMEAGLFDRISTRRLVKRGFFKPWDTVNGAPAADASLYPMKLGIVVEDDERGNRTLKSQTAQLARYGIKVASIFRSSGDVANAAAESQAATMRFRSEGITHIYGAGIFHLSTAEQQGYRPRYFFDHDSLNPIALTSPSAQLRGSMAESIVPAMATSEKSYPGHPKGYLPCLAVLKAAGIHPSSNLDHWSMQQLCDGFYPLRDAIGASGVLSNNGLRDGFTALGRRPVTAVTWTSEFTATQHASAVALRDVSFDEKCTCYVYDSSVNHSE